MKFLIVVAVVSAAIWAGYSVVSGESADPDAAVPSTCKNPACTGCHFRKPFPPSEGKRLHEEFRRHVQSR